MGEYAYVGGNKSRHVKIGTCEEMYYLRYDQRFLVKGDENSLNPSDRDILPQLRFRFPFPDEDSVAPGEFAGFERGLRIYGYQMPAEVEHYTIQMRHDKGYLMSIPCPESLPEDVALTWNGHAGSSEDRQYWTKIFRNGFSGGPALTQQKYVPGVGLVPIMKCLSCGAKWRLQERHDIEALVVAIRADADKYCRPGDESHNKFLHTVADRVLAGLEEK